MLSKLTTAYLILSTTAPILGFLTDYALAIVAITAIIQWVFVPRIVRCARRTGARYGAKRGFTLGRQSSAPHAEAIDQICVGGEQVQQ